MKRILSRLRKWLIVFFKRPVERKQRLPSNRGKDAEETGKWYFKRDILDKLDEYMVCIRRMKKTDPEGYKMYSRIGATTLPDNTLLHRRLGDNESGPVFVNRWGNRLSGRWVWKIVKNAVERIGMDPTQFGGHSLRAGFITSTANAGALERDIMKQTRHKTYDGLRSYIRDVGLFERNAANKAGL